MTKGETVLVVFQCFKNVKNFNKNALCLKYDALIVIWILKCQAKADFYVEKMWNKIRTYLASMTRICQL